MIFVVILAAALIQTFTYSASIASIKLKVTSTTEIRLKAQITLICEIRPAVTVKKYRLLKDGEMIMSPELPQKHSDRTTISYSFELVERTMGEYEFEITFDDDTQRRIRRRIDQDTTADDESGSGGNIAPDTRIGGNNGGNFPSEASCDRCPGNACSLYDGQQCAEEYLQCHYRENPKGLSKCAPGQLFLVTDAKNKKLGSCVSAGQCRRESQLPWIRHIMDS